METGIVWILLTTIIVSGVVGADIARKAAINRPADFFEKIGQLDLAQHVRDAPPVVPYPIIAGFYGLITSVIISTGGLWVWIYLTRKDLYEYRMTVHYALVGCMIVGFMAAALAGYWVTNNSEVSNET